MLLDKEHIYDCKRHPLLPNAIDVTKPVMCPFCREKGAWLYSITAELGEGPTYNVKCHKCERDFKFSPEEFKRICLTKNKEEKTAMRVTYSGFTGELVKLERVSRDGIGVPMGANFSELPFDLSIYDSEKQVTHSFTGVKLEDMKFLGGEVSFK